MELKEISTEVLEKLNESGFLSGKGKDYLILRLRGVESEN